MSSVTVVRATDIPHASAMWSRARQRIDTPTNERMFANGYSARGFSLGNRRPEWCWAALDPADDQVAFVAAAGSTAGVPAVIDVLDLPPDHPVAASALLAAAADTLMSEHQLSEIELVVYSPVDDAPLDRDDIKPTLAAIAGAGFELLVLRRNYLLRPASDDWHHVDTELTFQPVHSLYEQRLTSLHQALLTNSLDEHHRRALQQQAPAEVSREELASMESADGIGAFFIAVDATGRDVGLVVGAPWTEDRGAVAFVGVHPEFRGHGYAAQLTSWMTDRLVSLNVQQIIADTDIANTPMASAFRTVGFPQIQTRIDFVRRG